MPVTSLKTIPIYVWIPPLNSPEWYLEVVGSDTTNITSRVYSGKITDGSTDTIGTFTVTIDNSDGAYSNKWSGNELLNFYADYAQTAITKRFSGYIETIKYCDSKIILVGRSLASELMYAIVNTSYTNYSVSTILTDLLLSYAPQFDIGGVEVATELVTVSWKQKPLFDCIKELCELAGYDFFISPLGVANFFARNSRLNTTEAVIHNKNLIETGEFGADYGQVRNRITIYGANVDGIPLMYTAKSDSMYATLGNKWRDMSITNGNIATYEECISKAETLLADKIIPPIIGVVTSVGLPTIEPSQKVRISDPLNTLNPSAYRISQYTHVIEAGQILRTELTVEKQRTNLSTIIKIQDENTQKLGAVDNIGDVQYSYIFDFSTGPIGTGVGYTSDTRVLTGNGTWTSPTITAYIPPSSIIVWLNGPNTYYNDIEISFDGGYTKQSIYEYYINPITTTGTSIILYLTSVGSTVSEITSIAIQYK